METALVIYVYGFVATAAALHNAGWCGSGTYTFFRGLLQVIFWPVWLGRSYMITFIGGRELLRTIDHAQEQVEAQVKAQDTSQ